MRMHQTPAVCHQLSTSLRLKGLAILEVYSADVEIIEHLSTIPSVRHLHQANRYYFPVR